MKATRAEMEWLLNDTIKYYSKDTNRRCIDSKPPKHGTLDTCFYNPASVAKENVSDGCAIGRWMTQTQKQCADIKCVNKSVDSLPSGLIPGKLKKYDMGFLGQIQTLHDRRTYWVTSGLTPEGAQAVQNILNRIRTGVYD